MSVPNPLTFSLILSVVGSGRLRDNDSVALQIFSVRLSLNKLKLGADILDLILLTLFLTDFFLLACCGQFEISSVISGDNNLTVR